MKNWIIMMKMNINFLNNKNNIFIKMKIMKKNIMTLLKP